SRVSHTQSCTARLLCAPSFSFFVLPPQCLYLTFSFSFNDTATTEIYTLSLHDALPIWLNTVTGRRPALFHSFSTSPTIPPHNTRSEEHTSELQSRFDLVCRLLLEKKKYHKIDRL